MTAPSQGLRALASMMEAVVPQLSADAQGLLGEVAGQLHGAADAETAAEAANLGGPVAGPVLSAFATAMIDGFFASLAAGSGATAAPPAVAA